MTFYVSKKTIEDGYEGFSGLEPTLLKWNSATKSPDNCNSEYLVKDKCGCYFICWVSDGKFDCHHDFFDEAEIVKWAKLP